MPDKGRPPEDHGEALAQTVEQLRQERFPEIDADLVRAILRTHSDSASAETDIGRAVEDLVERYLAQGA